MKKTTLFFTLCVILLASCTKEDPISDQFNIYLKDKKLLSSSIESVPLDNHSEAIYVDSLGEEMVMTIQEFGRGNLREIINYRYNVYERGDTVRYIYKADNKSFYLINDDHNLKFHFELRPVIYGEDPETNFVGDVLNIWRHDAKVPTQAAGILSVLVDQRTLPNYFKQSKNIGTQIYFGKSFDDVFEKANNSYITEALFNFKEGLVVFQDHNNKTWRFDRFR